MRNTHTHTHTSTFSTRLQTFASQQPKKKKKPLPCSSHRYTTTYRFIYVRTYVQGQGSSIEKIYRKHAQWTLEMKKKKKSPPLLPPPRRRRSKARGDLVFQVKHFKRLPINPPTHPHSRRRSFVLRFIFMQFFFLFYTHVCIQLMCIKHIIIKRDFQEVFDLNPNSSLIDFPIQSLC